MSGDATRDTRPDVTPDKLSPADVLLYRRHSLLGRLIRAFDGKEVSHAALYLGTEVAEAVGEGLLRRSLLESRGADQRDYILAYRWREDIASDAFRPVVMHAETILARHPPYAHADVMLAAVLALTRKIPLTRSARFLVRVILDRATKALLNVAAPGRPEALMCSQFVFTCYRDTPPPLAALEIAGASAPDEGYESAADSAGVPLMASPPRTGPGIAEGSLLQRVGARWDQGLEGAEPALGRPVEVTDTELEAQLNVFEGELARESSENLADSQDPLGDEDLLEAMRRLAKTLLPPVTSGQESVEDDSESAPAFPSLPLFREVIANFVTPGDLSASPSLRLVGRIAL